MKQTNIFCALITVPFFCFSSAPKNYTRLVVWTPELIEKITNKEWTDEQLEQAEAAQDFEKELYDRFNDAQKLLQAFWWSFHVVPGGFIGKSFDLQTVTDALEYRKLILAEKVAFPAKMSLESVTQAIFHCEKVRGWYLPDPLPMDAKSTQTLMHP